VIVQSHASLPVQDAEIFKLVPVFPCGEVAQA
jgi:hypothetical protein